MCLKGMTEGDITSLGNEKDFPTLILFACSTRSYFAGSFWNFKGENFEPERDNVKHSFAMRYPNSLIKIDVMRGKAFRTQGQNFRTGFLHRNIECAIKKWTSVKNKKTKRIKGWTCTWRSEGDGPGGNDSEPRSVLVSRQELPNRIFCQ